MNGVLSRQTDSALGNRLLLMRTAIEADVENQGDGGDGHQRCRCKHAHAKAGMPERVGTHRADGT